MSRRHMRSSSRAEEHVVRSRRLASGFASLRDRLGSKDFQYPDLHPYDDALRILCLLPDTGDQSVIRCELHSTRLEECKDKFIGASYVWGPAEPSHTILVNRCIFSVRANLYGFLRALRAQQGSKKLYLWIDAICIDQSSIGERSSQVQQMGSLYSNAKCVYAWLGPDTHDAAWLFSQAGHRNDIFRRLTSLRSTLKPPPRGLYYSKHERANAEREARRLLASLVSIASCQYWTRIWIVQELLLARQVFFYSGSHSMSHALMSEWFYSVDLYLKYEPFVKEKLLLQHNGHSETLSRLLWISRLETKTLPRSLKTLIDDFTASSCTIAHDKIFALLGMTSHTERQYFVVDYSLPSTGVLYNVLHAIHNGNNIVLTTWRSLAQMSILPRDLFSAFASHDPFIDFVFESKDYLSHADSQDRPHHIYVDTSLRTGQHPVGTDLLHLLSFTGRFIGQIHDFSESLDKPHSTRLYGFAYSRRNPVSHLDVEAFAELKALHKQWLHTFIYTSKFDDERGVSTGHQVFGITVSVRTRASIIIRLAICEALIMLQVRRKHPDLNFAFDYLPAEFDHAAVNEDGFMDLLKSPYQPEPLIETGTGHVDNDRTARSRD